MSYIKAYNRMANRVLYMPDEHLLIEHSLTTEVGSMLDEALQAGLTQAEWAEMIEAELEARTDPEPDQQRKEQIRTGYNPHWITQL